MNQADIVFWTAILIILVLTLMMVLLLVWSEHSLKRRPPKNESFIRQEMKRLDKGENK
jgi:hypothetical protein